MSEDANAKLVYTLDGTDPKANSTQVNSGATVRIDKACTLKAALLTGGKVTGLTTKEYAIKAFEPKTSTSIRGEPTAKTVLPSGLATR